MSDRIDKLEEMVFKIAESAYNSSTASFKESVSSENISDKDEYFDDYLALTMGTYDLLCPSLQQLRSIIEVSRRIWIGSDLYKVALKRRRDKVIGDFIDFSLLPKGIESVEEQLAAGLTDETTKALSSNWDLFWKKNSMSRRVASLFTKWERDGTAYLRLFESDDAPAVRFVDPLAIEGSEFAAEGIPPGSAIPNSLGIVTEEDDIETVLGFVVKNLSADRSETDSEFVSANDMLQLKTETDFDSLVGLPLMYSVFTNMRRADTMLKNASVLVTIQTAIAMIRTHENATMSQISSIKNRNATGSRRVVDESRAREISTKRMYSGTILDGKKGTKYEFPAHGVESDKWMIPIHEELSRVAGCASIPVVWLLAKDSEEPLTPDSPYLADIKYSRSEFYDYMENLYWNVQARMGVAVDEVRKNYELVINGPVIPTAKPLDQARIDDIHIKHSAKSPQQLAREHGRRYVIQRSEIIAHRATKLEGEQFPGDAGMTNNGGDGETKADGSVRVAAGDGGNNE